MEALGLIETKGVIAAIVGADAMLKAADVNLLEKTKVGGGLVLIAVTGDVGAVKAAVGAGVMAVGMMNSLLLISQHVIPRPDEDLEDLIVSAIPQKNRNNPTVISEEIEKDAEEVPIEVKKSVVKDLEVEDSNSKEFSSEETITSLKKDLSNLRNKKTVDDIVLECGLEEAIEVLGEFKVVELRDLARKYKNFGIKGRDISKAGKKLLITKFKQYYEQTK